ncbi:hypothetical protein ACOME3_007835 [Neoechinorhynchus agilis]
MIRIVAFGILLSIAVALTYENFDVPGSAIRQRRQIIDGIVRNEGVKHKKPGSGNPQCSIFHSHKRTKSGTQIGGYSRHDQEDIKGFGHCWFNEVRNGRRKGIMNKHRTRGRVPSFMDSNSLNGLCHICSNEQIPEKTFTCPVETFNADETYCCGPPGIQCCCNEREYHEEENAAEAVNGRGRSRGDISIFKLLIMIILKAVVFELF